MSSHNDSYDFFGGEKIPYFPTKDSRHGEFVTGTICEEPFQAQQTDLATGKLKTWDDGKPMMQLVVTLQTNEYDPNIEDDDGRRRLYVKGNMRNAIGDAVRRVGSKGLDIGGTLTVTYIGDEPPKNPGLSAARKFTATYVNPSADFLGNGEAAQTNSSTGQASGHAGVGVSIPANLPPGVSAEVWQTLSPEAQAALANITAK